MYRPTLHILCGIPGAGKTHYAEKYMFDHYYFRERVVHLSSDTIRAELYGDETIQGDPSEVFSLMQKRTIEALNNGQDVFYDATNITRKDRACIISRCPSFVKIKVHVVWAPIETCIERDAARKRTVGKTVIDKMLKRFQAPYFDEGIDEIYISYPTGFDDVVYKNQIIDSLNIAHDNPHHSLNIQEHSLATGQYIREKQYDCLPLDAALFHDIGKPYVKSFTDSRGNPCDNAHYYQHQCVGAWMYYGIGAYAHTLSTISTAWLISTHMDPYLNTKYYNKLPTYLKTQVDLLHEADVAAH